MFVFGSRVPTLTSNISIPIHLPSSTHITDEMDTSVAVNDGSSANPVPQGFSLVTGPDNREYLVPDFLAADLQSAWERERTRELIGADVAARGVRVLPYQANCI